MLIKINKIIKFNLAIILAIILIPILSIIIASPAFSKENLIIVNVGDNFKIELEGNYTTGYQWQLDDSFDKEIINLESSVYVPTATDLVGAGGKAVWKFKTLKKGKTKLSFKYLRTWESVPPAEPVVYIIEVHEEKTEKEEGK